MLLRTFWRFIVNAIYVVENSDRPVNFQHIRFENSGQEFVLTFSNSQNQAQNSGLKGRRVFRYLKDVHP